MTSILPTAVSTSDEAPFRFIDRYLGIDKKIHPTSSEYILRGHSSQQRRKVRFIRAVDIPYTMSILEKAEGTERRGAFAPELDGAEEFMDRLNAEGVMLSAAHTSAAYDDISRAYDHGLKMLTHFYSGMSTITKDKGEKILGTVESGYLIDDLYTEIIQDGYHLPPELLKFIFRFKRNDRITGCSDSMRAAGMGEGPSILGPKENGLDVIVEDGVAKLPDRTAYAGSVAVGDTMARVLRSALGLTMPEIFRILSLQSAAALGIDNMKGSIEKGKDADIIVLDENLETRMVFLNGKRRK